MHWVDELLGHIETGTPAVLVTVASVEGSAPREAGTKMVVTAEDFSESIGGGQLEYQAIQQARDLIAQEHWPARLVDVPLGPQLGQCCGGRARLLYELIGPADRSWLTELARTTRGRSTIIVTRTGRAEETKWLWTGMADNPRGLDPKLFERLHGKLFDRSPSEVIQMDDDSWLVVDVVVDQEVPIYLFGAGHVGRALAVMLSLGKSVVTWVDSRPDAFPADVPKGVTVEGVDPPRFAVERAPTGAFYLVMTHSHALDLEICESVLRRGDFGYLGLIGSATKKAQFLKRLQAKGFTQEQLSRLTCPIGLPGVGGKEPYKIAASVAGDIWARMLIRGTLSNPSEASDG